MLIPRYLPRRPTFSPHRTTCSSALPPSWPRASVVPPKASQVSQAAHTLCHLAWPLGDETTRWLHPLPQRARPAASAPVDAAAGLVAGWLVLLLLLASNQAGAAATPAGTHPCTIAHARGPSPLCLCMQFISRNGGRACFSALSPPHFMVGFLSTCS